MYPLREVQESSFVDKVTSVKDVKEDDIVNHISKESLRCSGPNLLIHTYIYQ